MKLQVLAGALALGLGASALAPVAAHADDRAYRSYRSGGSYRSPSAYRSYNSYHSHNNSYRSYGSYHGHSNSYHGYAAYRPYGYRGYAYRGYAYRPYPAYPYYYGGYAPYVYGAPVAVVPPPYGYRPLVSVQVGGPHFGVWLGF